MDGIALSVHAPRPGHAATCHLDFDYGTEGTQLSGLVHYEPDPKTGLVVDRAGYTEVECITGDTEVYSDNADQFLSLLRELVEVAEQELTGLQEAASHDA
jgi:hypothetical protein